ncbi:unnamed protein product, partial [Polarella glacialis]
PAALRCRVTSGGSASRWQAGRDVHVVIIAAWGAALASRRQRRRGIALAARGGEDSALVDPARTVREWVPEEVDDYRVVPVCMTLRPPFPCGRSEICALVVSDAEDESGNDIMWQPPAGSSAQQAISAMRDAFGVLGVWPAAWVAAERVLSICRARQTRRGPPLRILEIGCGSGLPSLCALATGAEVVATDLEELPLKLLQAAATGQRLPGRLETRQVDVLLAASKDRRSRQCPSSGEAFDVIVCSDCLYKHDVARAIGLLLGQALLRRPGTLVVVTDANRRGRQEFLDTLASTIGLGVGDSVLPHFETVAVPDWAADGARDPFSGTETSEVGLLKLY